MTTLTLRKREQSRFTITSRKGGAKDGVHIHFSMYAIIFAKRRSLPRWASNHLLISWKAAHRKG